MEPNASTRFLNRNNPPGNGVNGLSLSAATLMDPKAMKKQLANGMALSFHSQSPDPPSHHSSDAPSTQTLLPDDISQAVFCMSPQDADLESAHEGKKMAKAPASMQAPSDFFDSRRLLDPKGFDKTSRMNGEAKTPTDVPPTPPTEFPAFPAPNQYTNGEAHPKFDFATTERDQDSYEGQGMGSLIEKAYNVGHREERPQKKRKIEKTEEFEEDSDRLNFSGSRGKGGDLGEYIKQKKQEGIKESGTVPNAVVDLTQGCYPLLAQVVHS